MMAGDGGGWGWEPIPDVPGTESPPSTAREKPREVLGAAVLAPFQLWQHLPSRWARSREATVSPPYLEREAALRSHSLRSGWPGESQPDVQLFELAGLPTRAALLPGMQGWAYVAAVASDKQAVDLVIVAWI